MLDVLAIRERFNKTRHGKWVYEKEYEAVVAHSEETQPWVACEIISDADGEFIAHAHEDIPALLDEIERLTELNGRLTTENNQLRIERNDARQALTGDSPC